MKDDGGRKKERKQEREERRRFPAGVRLGVARTESTVEGLGEVLRNSKIAMRAAASG